VSTSAGRHPEGPGAGPSTASPMVVVEHLSRSYPTPRGPVEALRDVSFTLDRGQVLALVGRSGAGKTTLLNCLGGLDRPTSGRVVLDGAEVTSLDERARTLLRREQLAFVFQGFGLLPVLSAAENVGLPLRLLKVDRRVREARVAELLDLVGLASHAEHRPSELSGGQQQRVAIARALANSPRLLIADEPTGQLDAETGASVLALLQSVVRSQRTTAIVSTHDPSVAAVADRTVRLADGALV